MREGEQSPSNYCMNKIYVGYDKRQPVAFNVLQHSIYTRASKPVQIMPLVIDWMPIKKRGLTDFTHTRFLVPYLSNYEGWSLFLDADMLCLDDISKIFEMADDKYAVMVCKNERKFEWPSFMLFNNAKCKNLTPEFVEQNNCLKMDWVKEEEIGSLPLEWNHLVGYDQPRNDPKLIHYTQGIPNMPETINDEHSDKWLMERTDMYRSASWQDMMGGSVHAKFRDNQKNGVVDYQQANNGLLEIKDVKFKPIKSSTELAENVKANLKLGYDFVSFDQVPNRKAILCASGYSLKQNIEQLIEDNSLNEYDIYTVAGAHDFLVNNGITPKGHFDCDPRPEKSRTVSLPNKKTVYMLASSSDPSYFEALKGNNIKIWHLLFDGIWDLVPQAQAAIAGGSNIGMTALCLLKALGYKEIKIYGLDCSFTDNHQYAYSGSSVEHKPIDVKCGDRWFKTSVNMAGACREFLTILSYLGDCNINLVGDGLLAHYCELNIGDK